MAEEKKLTGNKGEWSEPYALLKLLSDRKLSLGNDDFEGIEGLFYPISAIIRHEKDRNLNFSYDGDIVLISSKDSAYSISIKEFEYFAQLCKEKILEKKKDKGAFSIPEIEAFLNSFSITSLKAKSRNKHDITIQLEDPKTILAPTLGFSIKSQLGRPSTLVNASCPTNFIYKLSKKISDLEIKEFDSIKLFSDKLDYLRKLDSFLIYEKMESENFQTNLQTIDFNFERIIADMLILYYSENKAKNKTVPYITNTISEINAYKYNTHINPEIYEMMMKKFLVDYALGMRANEIWKRDYQASGGYLVIRSDGEILCYHFYFIKQFEDYLFNNTKFDTGDVKRLESGVVLKENGEQYVKLNLQIRFIK